MYNMKDEDISDEKYNQRKTEAAVYYKSIISVKCPYFNNDPVHFNADGFEHIIFKEWNKTRSRVDQYARFRLLPLAVSVIKRSGTMQEYAERNSFVRRKSKGGWNKLMKLVRYYVFIAIIGELRIKVVVKEIEGGSKNFHTMYPSWEIEKRPDGSKIKKLYSGNLETD